MKTRARTKEDAMGASGAALDTIRAPTRRIWHAKMHMAIKKLDLATIRSQLDAGDSFCATQCFLLAASSSENLGAERWKLLKKMLRANPNGLNSTSEDGVTLLMILCTKTNDKDIIHHLVKLGAKVNAEDNKGETALVKLFEKTQFEEDIGIKKVLLNAGADPTKGNLICKIADSVNQSTGVSVIVYTWKRVHSIWDMLINNWKYKQSVSSLEDLLLSLPEHPLFYFIDFTRLDPFYYSTCISFLHQSCNAGLIINKKAIRTSKLIDTIDLSWKAQMNASSLPFASMDPVGYFLYSLNVSHFKPMQDVFDMVKSCFLAFLENGFESGPDDMHPMYALLCNIYKHFRDINGHAIVSDFVSFCFQKFKDHLPHRLTRTYKILDFLMFMYYLMKDDAADAYLDMVFSVMKLTPEHPYYTFMMLIDFDMNLKSTHKLFLRRVFRKRLADKILPYVGSLSISGIDKRVSDKIDEFVHKHHPSPDQVQLFIKNCHAGPASLKMLSIWVFRSHLFKIRPDNRTALPAMIGHLCDQGYLPRCLKSDLLLETSQGNWSILE